MMPKSVTKTEALILERQLAIYANVMDSLVRIPFTRQGVGLDGAIGTIPVVGDIAGLGLTLVAIFRAWQIGVPMHKLLPALKLALVDLSIGWIPVVGDLSDIFIRPSRKALDIVHTHLRDVHGIQTTDHIDHPVLHRMLEIRQKTSAFWRHPVISWLWLRIPDLIGIFVLFWLCVVMYFSVILIWGLFPHS
jgi:hypothetical protein